MASLRTLRQTLTRIKAPTSTTLQRHRDMMRDVARALVPLDADPLFFREYAALLQANAWTDAALLLVEQVLPGCEMYLWRMESGLTQAHLIDAAGTSFIELAPTAPLALLKAVVASGIDHPDAEESIRNG